MTEPNENNGKSAEITDDSTQEIKAENTDNSSNDNVDNADNNSSKAKSGVDSLISDFSSTYEARKPKEMSLNEY